MPRAHVTYDEIDDVLASSDLLAIVTPRLAAEPALWKWAIIAAQSGLQGAIVCALRDTMGVGVLDEKSACAIIKWHDDREGKYPREKLADFFAPWSGVSAERTRRSTRPELKCGTFAAYTESFATISSTLRRKVGALRKPACLGSPAPP